MLPFKYHNIKTHQMYWISRRTNSQLTLDHLKVSKRSPFRWAEAGGVHPLLVSLVIE